MQAEFKARRRAESRDVVRALFLWMHEQERRNDYEWGRVFGPFKGPYEVTLAALVEFFAKRGRAMQQTALGFNFRRLVANNEEVEAEIERAARWVNTLRRLEGKHGDKESMGG